MARRLSGTTGRTPLFAALRDALHLATAANGPAAPPVAELVERRRAARLSRRQFLRAGAAASLAIGAGGLARGIPPARAAGAPAPRVAIVGAGIAGLHAAYRLKEAGIDAIVYEGSGRVGGRIMSATDLLGPGLVTELGGEFIDSGHEDMLALAEEFALPLIDLAAPAGDDLIREAYFFGGQHYSEAQVVEAFRPVAARIAADYAALGETVDFENEGGGTALDRTSLAAYLDQLGATGWLRDLLEVAYVSEYGLDAAEQSALNLIFLIGTDLSEETFALFGESDERYVVRGGNARITDELARRLPDRIAIDHRLEAIRPDGGGFALSFLRENGTAVAVDADYVILAIPFTLLREVDLGRLELPAWKRNAIANLGYGTGTKVLAGMRRRVWRARGYDGTIYSDEGFQSAWENSRGQEGEAGGLTFFLGGAAGLAAGSGSVAAKLWQFLPGFNRAFPGTRLAVTGRLARFHWPTYPWSKGSYAAYRPGQWTTIAGAEIKPVGNLLFAGEHCSYDFQGFMNGGAETGRRAAETILARAGLRSAAPAHRPSSRRQSRAVATSITRSISS